MDEFRVLGMRSPHLEEALRDYRARQDEADQQRAQAEAMEAVAPVSAAQAACQGDVLAATLLVDPDARVPHLLALFNACDERGKQTILAFASVSARLTKRGL